jgi:hypothetical protein
MRIVPRPLDVIVTLDSKSRIELVLPSDFTIAELREHMSVTTDLISEVPMLLGLRTISIYQEDTELEDEVRLSELTKSSSVSLRAVVGELDEDLSRECQKLTNVTRLLREHTQEEVELVKHNHMVQTKHREAQAAVMDAWLQYEAYSESLSDEEGGLLPTPDEPWTSFLASKR